MALWTFCYFFSILSISLPSLHACQTENIMHRIECMGCFPRELLRCRKGKPTSVLGSLDQMVQSRDCTKSWGAIVPSSGCNSSPTEAGHSHVCVVVVGRSDVCLLQDPLRFSQRYSTSRREESRAEDVWRNPSKSSSKRFPQRQAHFWVRWVGGEIG